MLTIVTVAYRSGRDLPSLLASIAERPPESGPPQTIVVDNTPDAPDGVGALVRERFPWAEYLPMPRNVGMGAGLNAGVRGARGDALLLVNPDLVFEAGALARFDAYGTRGPAFAAAAAGSAMGAPRPMIVGPRLLNGDGSLQLSAGRFPNLLRLLAGQLRPRAARKYIEPRTDRPSRVDWVTGACLWMPRAAFHALGGFDERYFLYYEETDLCRRARRRGWPTVYDPTVVCTHLHPLQDRQPNPVVAGHIRDSRRLYFREHCGPLESAALGLMDRFA